MLKKYIKKILDKIRGKETSTEKYIKLGMKVGKNFHRQAGCTMDDSHCWLITIGDNVTFSQNVHLIAHDASTTMIYNDSSRNVKDRYCKIGQITIGNNVFIGYGSIVLCNVSIGDNVIIGAGSVVTHDIPSNSIACGNPAKVVSNWEDFTKKNLQLMDTHPCWNEKYTTRCNITESMKSEMNEKLKTYGYGFVK